MEHTIDIILSADQLEGTAAKICSWLIEIGAAVTAGEPIVELETDKVLMEVCAPATGQLQGISKFSGDAIESGTVLGKLLVINAPIDEPITSQHTLNDANTETVIPLLNAATRHDSDNNTQQLLGPAVRRLLREKNLDINLIPGTGCNGRVTRDDVLAYLEKPPSNSAIAITTTTATTTTELVGKKIPHSPMRKAIASHMVNSLLHTSPHVTSVFEMELSNVIEHRGQHKKEFADQGINLTFTAYFLAATVKAMAEVPQMNARYHDDGLELFDDINIGVGTALDDDGLVVPVVRQVQTKNLFDISKALQAQTEKAHSGKLSPADMKNGTFTISNHGVSGSLFATPIIINQPQVAILGIGKLEKRAVVREVNGEDCIQIKPMCYVSLSIDHRAVDAFQTNRFLSVFVETINHWETAIP